MQINKSIVPGSGVPLNCYTAGDGTPMIMLHGHPDCGYGWINQFEFFCGSYKIVAPDLRGCGFSGKPGSPVDYSIEKLVLDLAAVVDHFDMKDVTFVGHDWGGIICWYYASYYPDRVSNLISICAPHPVEYVRALSDPRQRQASGYIRRVIESGTFDVALDTYPERFRDENVLAAFLVAMKETDYRSVSNYYRSAMQQSIKFPFAGIPKVTAPVLVIYSRRDPAIIEPAYRNTGQWVSSRVTTVALELATHFPHQQAAGAVNAKIEKWLAVNS